MQWKHKTPAFSKDKDDSVDVDLEMMPMPTSGDIEAFCKKLCTHMAALGCGDGGAEPCDRDELLREHWQQHAAMHEWWLKEIKEKIKWAEEEWRAR